MTRSATLLRHLLVGTALAAGLVGPALANDNTPVQDLPTVVLQGNTKNDKHAGAADRGNSIYISEKDIEASATGNMKDLFAGQASVTVGGGIPIAQKIFVNGVDLLNLAVSVDGVAQNNRAFHHTTATTIDPELLKSVRVDPTVAPADAGPHAMAGAVQFDTVDVGDLLSPERNIGAYGRLSYDTNGNTFTQSGAAYGRHSGFELLGYIKNAKGQDYEAGNGRRVRGTGADLQSFLVKGAYEKDGHRLELSGMRMIDDALRPWRANFGGMIGGRPTPLLRRYDTDRQNYSIRYEGTHNTGLWDPTVLIGFSENHINVPEPYGSKGKSNTLNGKVENTFHFTETNALTAGLDFYAKTGRYSDPTSRLTEKAQNVGLYVQERLSVTDRIELSFGGRADFQSFEGVNRQTRDQSGVSGNASVRYEVIDNLFLKAGYSNVFGGLVIEDNYTYSPKWTYSALRPARAQNVVGGIEWRHDGFFANAEVFRTDFDNARNGIKTDDFITQGFNLGGGWSWGDGSIKATYSNTEIEVNGKKTGGYESLDYGAPLGQVIAVEAQHKFADYGVTVGSRLDMALDYDGPVGAEDAKKTLKGYHVFNMFLQYEPVQLAGLQLRLEANNIFDADYADRGTYGGEYTSVQQLKEPGRSFLFTVKKTF